MNRPARWSVAFTPAAERDFKSVPPEARRRVQRCIDELEFDPRPAGVRKLNTNLELWRVRVGAYRVVYSIDDSSVTVLVIRVRNRRDAYKGI